MESTIKTYNQIIERLNTSIKQMNYRRHFDKPTGYINLLTSSSLTYSDIPLLDDIFSNLIPLLSVYNKELFKDREDALKLNELEQDLKEKIRLLNMMKCFS